ncbi:unnamed protein product [Toxocara canis]|uniref:Pex24p domain-containing protein n=1 Tax=Toxocara canis TaxID=6265 RepID=A0A183U149_TOXCA|nr:unnamed protein product [Toxocara canis]
MAETFFYCRSASKKALHVTLVRGSTGQVPQQQLAVMCLRDAAKLLGSISHDPAISIPDVIITMNDGPELLAYARVRINEEEAVAGVVEVRMWFGKAQDRSSWEKAIEPGRIHYLAEVFENEWRETFTHRWHASDNGGEFARWTDETRSICLNPHALFLHDGWNFLGERKTLPCHQMWIGPDANRIEYEEELFEVQTRKGNDWKLVGFTKADGGAVPGQGVMNLMCPQGWRWIGEWTIDRTLEGDACGWSYALENTFNELDSRVDHAEGTEHNFRRRRWRRIRVENAGLADKDFATFRTGVKSAHWEV